LAEDAIKAAIADYRQKRGLQAPKAAAPAPILSAAQASK
jgi:hypothetical protein